jgi:crotonobetainyl-CoA:carnitine CoA-transferase CaiB-like acyl-CoA transferase
MGSEKSMTSQKSQALDNIRICDFTGQLAGAGATKILAAFGAEVIRIEDPIQQGKWDILRGVPPWIGNARGLEAGGAFNNHNAGKLGITLNLRDSRAKELLRELVRISDAVTENFASGVMERLGFGYEDLRSIREDIVYVSNNGFGATGPYAAFKSWGPIAQAVSGLTYTSGLPDLPPAGWGYSFMDHTGGYYMATAVLMALIHRQRTGQGQWVDLACIEAAGTLNGVATLDATVNQRPMRREGMPNSNRSQSPKMSPHGIWPTKGHDNWIAIAVRDDREWQILSQIIGETWSSEDRWTRIENRVQDEDELEELLTTWTLNHDRQELAQELINAGVPSAPVLKPQERIEYDQRTAELWVTVEHTEVGQCKVEGLPVRMSETPWSIARGAACLGEHNQYVFGELLGLSDEEIETLAAESVI